MTKKNIFIFDNPALKNTILGDKGILETIKLCLKEERYIPALILTFTCIDTMAFLSMPENKEEHKGEDFI